MGRVKKYPDNNLLRGMQRKVLNPIENHPILKSEDIVIKGVILNIPPDFIKILSCTGIEDRNKSRDKQYRVLAYGQEDLRTHTLIEDMLMQKLLELYCSD